MFSNVFDFCKLSGNLTPVIKLAFLGSRMFTLTVHLNFLFCELACSNLCLLSSKHGVFSYFVKDFLTSEKQAYYSLHVRQFFFYTTVYLLILHEVYKLCTILRLACPTDFRCITCQLVIVPTVNHDSHFITLFL